MAIRINHLLARYGFCSRRKADDWVRAGRVSVDGVICRQVGTRVDPGEQRIAVDGKLLQKPPVYEYIALHKPRGVITTTNDPRGRPTVMEYLPSELKSKGIFPVGRLDFDSEGLLLMTNDGDWGRILLHPSHRIWKTYLVRTDRPLTRHARERLERGIELDWKRTLGAKIKTMSANEEKKFSFFFSIREGRKRQIRRMCAAVGLSILSLKRISVGSIELNELETGTWRRLRPEEVECVFQFLSHDKRNERCT